MSKIWKHDELLNDLQDKYYPMLSITGRIFINQPLESVFMNQHKGKGNCTPIADMVIVYPSYTDFKLTIIEVKVTRSDFQSDIRTEKWKKYLPYCNRFYFAMPFGLVKKSEIPAGVGLLVRSEKSWSARVRSNRRFFEIPTDTIKALLFRTFKRV